MLKTKPKAETDAPDFEAARERFDKATEKYEALQAAVENTRAALYMSNTADSARASIAPSVRERAQSAYPRGLPRRAKLIRQAEDAADALEDATPAFQVERELYAAAARRETARIAQELQPRHRATVQKIAQALEDLSRALEAEAEVRAELAREAPEAISAFLPNCSAFLQFGSLVDWNTPASQWARKMREIGILE